MENKNIYTELQKVRHELSTSNLKKTGKNKYAGFEYFELGDFLPRLTELFDKHELCPIFRMEYDQSGIEYAYLTIVKDNEQVMFRAPTANPKPSTKDGGNPIQELGSKITYMRRYLYLMALDIVENDVVDAVIGSEQDKSVALATPGQISIIQSNGKLIAQELTEINCKTLNDLKSLTKEKATELVSLIKERQENAKANVQG